jgi:ferritin
MLSKKMEKALNGQVNAELYSAYIYLSMAANFTAQNWLGCAHWMRVQAKEEQGHATKIYEFILERNGKVVLEEVAKPQTYWPTPLAAFETAYAHEQKVTGMIGDLVNQAAAEKDHATAAFLQWFVTEQVEEEAQTLIIVEQMKLIGDSKGSLFMLDHQLSKRE